MEIALVQGVRAFPSPGAQGQCQMCGAAMTAKCGEQVIWHWAHKVRRVCDPWWENEGEWHRAWKTHFPEAWHEIVQHDSAGEKHVADVKLSGGLVVELQHSAMPLDEMRSREAFYGNMVWIVDADPFKKNLHIFHPLPDPTEPFVADLSFVTPVPEWRGHQSGGGSGFDSLMFFRRSERVEGTKMQLLHTGREIAEHFPVTYQGHHLYLWMKPREVWYQTTKPTYLDLGDDLVALLAPYGPWRDTILCLKLLSKHALIGNLLEQKI
jgi:competence protein CoiA